MKLTMKPKTLKFLILGTGAAGFVLRKLLYATGFDGRNLLVSGHWTTICLVMLTALTAGALLGFGLPLKGSDVYKESYPVSFGGMVGCFAAAAGVAYTVVPEFGDFSTIADIFLWVLGLAAALAFAVIGICRLIRVKPYFLLHGAICVYLALRVVTKYRLWSADPQLMDYCFYLLSYVALMLSVYHHAAFDAGMGNHRALWIFSLAGVYLACVSLATRQDMALLAGCALWAFTNLTNLNLRVRRQRPRMNPDAEE